MNKQQREAHEQKQEALQKFEFRAIILDEAQFIKNPSAQVTV